MGYEFELSLNGDKPLDSEAFTAGEFVCRTIVTHLCSIFSNQKGASAVAVPGPRDSVHDVPRANMGLKGLNAATRASRHTCTDMITVADFS